jgi:hypothetical protein
VVAKISPTFPVNGYLGIILGRRNFAIFSRYFKMLFLTSNVLSQFPLWIEGNYSSTVEIQGVEEVVPGEGGVKSLVVIQGLGKRYLVREVKSLE